MLVDVGSIVDSVRFLGLNLGVWVRKLKQFALEVLCTNMLFENVGILLIRFCEQFFPGERV